MGLGAWRKPAVAVNIVFCPVFCPKFNRSQKDLKFPFRMWRGCNIWELVEVGSTWLDMARLGSTWLDVARLGSKSGIFNNYPKSPNPTAVLPLTSNFGQNLRFGEESLATLKSEKKTPTSCKNPIFSPNQYQHLAGPLAFARHLRNPRTYAPTHRFLRVS